MSAPRRLTFVGSMCFKERKKSCSFDRSLGVPGTLKNTRLYTYIEKKNLEENVIIFQKKQNAILKENFFSQSEEVIFRSFGEVIKIIGKKYYIVRGKKIDKIIDLVKSKIALSKSFMQNFAYPLFRYADF